MEAEQGHGCLRGTLAARQGDITQVKHVDYEMLQVLGLFGKYTTVVYGD